VRGRLIVLILVLTASCSSGSHRSTPATTRPTTVTTTRPAPTTTVLAPQPTPSQAANAFLNAWRTGDRVTAARVALPGAVAEVFVHPPADFSNRGCQDPVGGQASCAFGSGGGLIAVHTVMSGSGWLVDQVTFE
jgi:hypothetical protein